MEVTAQIIKEVKESKMYAVLRMGTQNNFLFLCDTFHWKVT